MPNNWNGGRILNCPVMPLELEKSLLNLMSMQTTKEYLIYRQDWWPKPFFSDGFTEARPMPTQPTTILQVLLPQLIFGIL